MGKQATDFLIFNDIVIEEYIHEEYQEKFDPLSINDKWNKTVTEFDDSLDMP